MSRTNKTPSRREFFKTTGAAAATTALAGMVVPHVHAAENNTIQVALIGCGGRGTGAAADALSVKQGPLKLVAMADAFQDRLNGSYNGLKDHGDKVDVPKERQFVGLEAYKHAMDCLKPGDIAIFATPPAFRWVHFTYAVQKGLNVFMEKPVTVDGPTTRRMIELGKAAAAKNLKVGVGLMSRHSRHLEQLSKRIQDGEIGDIVLMRGYRMHGPVGSMASPPKPAGTSEMEYQLRRFHSFLWASGGCYSDFYIHIIDHCCWMKGAWPVSALGLGGRHYRDNNVDQNFDTYSIEYTFADETKFIMDGRCMGGCDDVYKSFAHGTKGTAIMSRGGDCGGPSSTFKGLGSKQSDLLWTSKVKGDEGNPYQNEWNDLVDAIRNDKPYNEVERGAMGSLVTSLGRMSAHTGNLVTLDEILNGPHEFAPGLDKITKLDEPAPLMPGPNGKYPVPQPGLVTKREY